MKGEKPRKKHIFLFIRIIFLFCLFVSLNSCILSVFINGASNSKTRSIRCKNLQVIPIFETVYRDLFLKREFEMRKKDVNKQINF